MSESSGSGESRWVFLLLILINVNFALDFPITKAVLEEVTPAVLLFWRWVFAVLVFVPAAFLDKAPPLRRNESMSRGKMVLLLLIAGVLAQTISSVIMNTGLTMTLAANLSVLFLTVPVFASLLAALLLNERLRANRVLGLALALLGTVLISDIQWRDTALMDNAYLLGNLLILLSCAGFALGVILTKLLLAKLSYLRVNAYVFSIALLTVIPFAYQEDPNFLFKAGSYSWTVWPAFLKIGSVWALAAIGFTWVLSRLEASRTSVSLYLTPVFGVVSSALLLGESITLVMILGLTVTLLGLVLVVYEEQLRRKWKSITH
ncbi:MAG TPA: DMT family transporter [Acidobacteriota bacterium]|nr:DMT family transporter [Acidobacteriota bacterium]